MGRGGFYDNCFTTTGFLFPPPDFQQKESWLFKKIKIIIQVNLSIVNLAIWVWNLPCFHLNGTRFSTLFPVEYYDWFLTKQFWFIIEVHLVHLSVVNRAIWVWILPCFHFYYTRAVRFQPFSAVEYYDLFLNYLILVYRGQHSTLVAFALHTKQPRVRFSASAFLFLMSPRELLTAQHSLESVRCKKNSIVVIQIYNYFGSTELGVCSCCTLL